MDSKVEVHVADSAAQISTNQPQTVSLREARRSFERRYILEVLEHCCRGRCTVGKNRETADHVIASVGGGSPGL